MDCVPVISNTGYGEESQGEFLRFGVYDFAKENRAYLDLLKKFDLSDLTFEELVGLLFNLRSNNTLFYQQSWMQKKPDWQTKNKS